MDYATSDLTIQKNCQKHPQSSTKGKQNVWEYHMWITWLPPLYSPSCESSIKVWIFFSICFGCSKNRPIEMVLLSTHKLCFIWLIGIFTVNLNYAFLSGGLLHHRSLFKSPYLGRECTFNLCENLVFGKFIIISSYLCHLFSPNAAMNFKTFRTQLKC